MTNDKTGKTTPVAPKEKSEIPHTQRIKGISVPTERMLGKIRKEPKDPTDSIASRSL